MTPQIANLPAGLRGTSLNSSMSKTQRETVIKDLVKGVYHVLFVAPETVISGWYVPSFYFS
jgi:superfamily II DNA helicase RecQ